MLAPLLFLSIAAGSVPSASALEQIPRDAPSADASMVVLDCQIVDKALSACQVVGEASVDQSAAALKLASTLKVPDVVLENMIKSGVSHVRIRLNVPPAGGPGAATPASNGAKPEQNGINP